MTHHYERCGRYYGNTGWGSHGSATEEERRLTMMLFSGIFDALAQRAYDPELFSTALPCLSSIDCALSPDYSLTNTDETWYQQGSADSDGAYNPTPVDTARVHLPNTVEETIAQFCEHFHDSFSMKKVKFFL